MEASHLQNDDKTVLSRRIQSKNTAANVASNKIGSIPHIQSKLSGPPEDLRTE